MLPFEKKTIRIYMFYFKGYKDPLIIEAENKKIAEDYLIEEVTKIARFVGPVELEDFRMTTPVYGITEKDIKGIPHVWVGLDLAGSGWLSKTEFIKLKKR